MTNSIINNTSFLLIGQPNSENFKRLKRKINKQKISHLFKSIKNTNILESIKQNLIEIKQNKSTENICILTDQNIIVHNIQNLPEPPNDWDILTLQYDVKKYLFNNEHVHWSKLEILNSNHFIINNKIINTLLEKLKTCKSFSDFISILNTLNLYGITQSFFSEKIDHFIHFPYDKYNCKKTLQTDKNNILLNHSQTAFNKLKLLNINPLDWNNTINYFDSKLSTKTPSEKYVILPSISIICIISDAPKFIHLLHTFLKLNYPIDKLELIVVDHLNIEKKLKNVIPNDKRIKIINIQNKTTITDPKILPLGYLLNLGIKYSSNNLIFNFFDTSIYFPETFRNIIKCYLLSGKDLLIGNHILQLNKQTNKCFKNNTYNISNMLYSKKYWLTNMFQEINDPNVILYKFMSFRTNTISKIPSVFWSFQLHNQQITTWNEPSQINLNLETLIIDQSIKESYNLIWE